jgi:hypothetical protein
MPTPTHIHFTVKQVEAQCIPASSPLLRAVLNTGISFPSAAIVLLALGLPSTVRASARSRETLKKENHRRQGLQPVLS